MTPARVIAEIAEILDEARRQNPSLYSEALEWVEQGLFERRNELKDAAFTATTSNMIADDISRLTRCDRRECRAIAKETLLLSRAGVVLFELRRFAAKRLNEKGGKRGSAA